MGSNNKYWNGLEEYNQDASFQQQVKKEFQEELPIEKALSEDTFGVKANRRDFLKVFGFGLTAATLAACVEKPVKKAIPYVIKPDNITPGVPSWYASTCQGCAVNCGVLVKTREGRPIKMEGNPISPINKGGLCPIGQASVLDLYDAARLAYPKYKGERISWEDLDIQMAEKLSGLRNVRVVTGTVNSPSTQAAINKFLSKFENGKHLMYDAVSYSAIRKAHKETHGAEVLPTYTFEDAKVVVSFGADFLNTWVSPVEHTKGWVKNRKVTEKQPKMSRHIQYEAELSLTGSNADFRGPMRPSQYGVALLNLHNLVASKVGGVSVPGVPAFKGVGNSLDSVAKELVDAKGKSLVVCGLNDVSAQVVVNKINQMLGNYGKTVHHDKPAYSHMGDEEKFAEMVKQMGSGQVDAVLFWDVNPAYNYSDPEGFKAALSKVGLKAAFSFKENETTDLCDFVCADTHFLESWNDANPRKGVYSITQPTIRAIFDNRQTQASLLKWAGEDSDFLSFMQKYWQDHFFPMQSRYMVFEEFWNATLKDGVFTPTGNAPASHMEDAHHEDEHHEMDAHAEGDDSSMDEMGEPIEVVGEEVPTSDNMVTHSQALISWYNLNKDASKVELVLYQKGGIKDGRSANNPWLQELPDAITKVTWDNYVCVPYVDAQAQGLKDGDHLTVSVGKKAIGALPVLVMPGQARGTLAVALGYGRTKAGKVADGLGVNAFPMVEMKAGAHSYHAIGASTAAADGHTQLAKTQTFIGYDLQDAEGVDKRTAIEDRVDRYILKETYLDSYAKNPFSGNKRPSEHHMISLWDTHDKKGHHWAMAIDLNACTGCGSCIVSCNAENNIPVVGKYEVLNRREMHWMRIDRYFNGKPSDQEGALDVMQMPMLCQHCDNAPCETVCPVLATVHSDEGLNQQVYNRCIGTRYCANNCPYKVRRFNWFSYYSNEDYRAVNSHMFEDNKVGRLVLNPDVTVRARGVMEKCSFCVQRIQAAKLKAKVERRKLKDGEIKTACQQSCPADAIVFGDLNDKHSDIHKLYQNKRTYHALEDVKTLPSVAYMTKVRNKTKAEQALKKQEEATEA